MKTIKVKKEHRKIFKEMRKEMDNIMTGVEELITRFSIRKKNFWEQVRKEYPETKEQDFCNYDFKKNEIIVFEDRLEALKDKMKDFPSL